MKFQTTFFQRVLGAKLSFMEMDFELFPNRSGENGAFTEQSKLFDLYLSARHIEVSREKFQWHSASNLIQSVPVSFFFTFSFGACANFGTSHSKWAEYFPKIRPKLTTLRANFMVPGFRELLLTAGFSSASENSLKTLLSQSHDPADQMHHDGCTSNAVGLVVGGIREVFYTQPDKYQFIVAKRRGFVRIALQTGASLVPAISFGENNVYRMIDVQHGFWRRLVEFLFQKYTDRFAAIQNGRGIFQYSFGMLPLRHPINTVIGAPIHLDKIFSPSDATVDKIHEQFCAGLKELFETHKSKYVENYEQVQLEFV